MIDQEMTKRETQRQAAAKRALAEAQVRQKQQVATKKSVPELGGPKGVEPTRFGDWERKGIASDF